MQCSAFTLLFLLITAVLLYFKFGIADARGLDGASPEVCTKVDAGEVTLCLEPMIQLSEELANDNPIVNRIIFPLFNFKQPDLNRICQIWSEMHVTCLNAGLRTRCSQHGLLKILNSLFTFSCSEGTSELFFSHFPCLSQVMDKHEECIDMMVVSPDPDLRPESKCDPVPQYYACLEEGIVAHCNVTGLDVFRLTLDTFGCAPPEIDPKFLLGSDNNLAVQSIPERNSVDAEYAELPETFEQPTGFDNLIPVQNPLIEAEEQKTETNNIRRTEPFLTNVDQEQQIGANQEANDDFRDILDLPDSDLEAESIEKRFENREGTFSDDSGNQNRDEITKNRVLSVQQNVIELQSPKIPSSSSNDIQIIDLRGEGSEFGNGHATPGERSHDPESLSNNFLSSQTCPEPTRSQARTCLQPVMQRWHRLAQKEPMLSNVTFPLFLMDRDQVLDLCDLYASAFLDCQLETFQICSQDPIVEFSDAMLGYACGNAIEFFRSYDCLSVIAQDSGSEECRKKIQIGIAEDFDRRCAGINEFYLCIRETVEAICPVKSLTVLNEAIKYYGCDL